MQIFDAKLTTVHSAAKKLCIVTPLTLFVLSSAADEFLKYILDKKVGGLGRKPQCHFLHTHTLQNILTQSNRFVECY